MSSLSEMRILLTGATTRVGRSLTLKLFEAGHDLIVLCTDRDQAEAELPLPLEFVDWDGVSQVVPWADVEALIRVEENGGGSVECFPRTGDFRKVELHADLVLSRGCDELRKPLARFRLDLARKRGNGRKWIHLDDLVAMYLKALSDLKWVGNVEAFVGGQSGFEFAHLDLDQTLDNLLVLEGSRNARELTTFQWVAKPLSEIFSFFSAAENLEVLTPPFLGFKITKKSSSKMEAGTLIDYRLSLHGLPMKWRTLIETWEPPRVFTDIQLKGPYQKWHHTHTFTELRGGTMMKDRVIYELPVGKLGALVAGRSVRNDVRGIFDFRRKKIRELF